MYTPIMTVGVETYRLTVRPSVGFGGWQYSAITPNGIISFDVNDIISDFAALCSERISLWQ